MRIFVAASYSSQLNYKTGEARAKYKLWLESELRSIEKLSNEVFCVLREDRDKINDVDPAVALLLT